MQKLLGILILVLFLGGCSSNMSGGSTIGIEGSSAWLKWAPHEDLVRYYSKYDVDELCDRWKNFDESSEFKRTKNRNAIKEILVNKGEDRLLCMKLPST